MLDTKALKNIAHLARIAVTDDELEKLGNELSSIISFVDQVSAVDTSGVKNSNSAVQNIARDDVVAPIKSAYDLVEATPENQDNFVKVPKVIGE